MIAVEIGLEKVLEENREVADVARFRIGQRLSDGKDVLDVVYPCADGVRAGEAVE